MLASKDRPSLTGRQLWLLQEVARGSTLAAAARSLEISERHARRILRQIWEALGVEGRSQGLVAAGRMGLIEADGGAER